MLINRKGENQVWPGSITNSIMPGEGKSRTGIYVRLIVIFLVDAGLTAGLIYYLIPKSDDGSAVSDPAAHETQLPSRRGGNGTAE